MSAPYIDLPSGTTPAAPGAGTVRLFVNSSVNLTALVGASTVERGLFGGGAFSTYTPADPNGTTDTTGKMMGLAMGFTPIITGRIAFFCSGNLTNSTAAAGDGAKAQMYYGTGTAPANAAAITGTAIGTMPSMLLERATASDPFPFALVGGATGLTINTTYWLDLVVAAIAGGTGVAKTLSFLIVEI